MSDKKKLEFRAESIPQILKKKNKWVVFMRDPYGKKTPFVAVDANAKDQKADISNPETWTTFENALAFYKQRKTFDAVSYYQTLSLGYAMTAEDNLIFSDLDLRLDGLNDAEKKVAVQRFRAVVNVCSQLESYGEISVSGEGQHYLIRGKLDDAYAEGRAKEMPIELYSKDRFVIMTGHRLNDFDISDNDRSVGLINNIQKHYFELKGQAVSDWSQKPIISVLNKQRYSDDEVLGVALKDTKFNLLWNGRWQEVEKADGGHYSSQHYADKALINKICFYCGPYPEQIERIYRRSPSYQAYGKNGKWSKYESDIRKDIKTACAGCRAMYQPSAKERKRNEVDGFLNMIKKW